MTDKLPLLALLVLIFCSLNLRAQEARKNKLNPEQQQAIEKRWMESQPIIMVRTDSDRQYTGQPIHASMDTVYLLPGTGLPVGAEWFREVQRISFNEIEEVLLQRWANRLQR